MMDYVREYVDGKKSRMDFDLDFSYYLMKYYDGMARKNRDLAECFYFYLAEEGFDQSAGLSDAAHKKLIRKQWMQFLSVKNDGFC
jgi:hypothetical protein